MNISARISAQKLRIRAKNHANLSARNSAHNNANSFAKLMQMFEQIYCFFRQFKCMKINIQDLIKNSDDFNIN